MSFKSHISFYRQVPRSLMFLYFLFFIIIGVTSFLLYQYNIQKNELTKNRIPEFEFIYQYKEYLKLNNGLALELNNSESSDELVDVFNQIKVNLNDIANLDLINIESINRLIAELNEIDNVVNLIAINDPKNNKLKQTSVEQLHILINKLVAHIELKSQAQLKLYKKITPNNNTYIPVSNAIKYIEASKVLNQLDKVLVLLNETVLGFEPLSIKYSVAQLEDITNTVDLAITSGLSVLSSNPIDTEIRESIESLQALLNVEQRVLGKWYSHLKLSEQIFNRAELINQKLSDLYPSHNEKINFISSDSLIPDFVIQLTQSIQYRITIREYYYGLIGILMFSILSLLTISFRTKIQAYAKNTVSSRRGILPSDDAQEEQAEYDKPIVENLPSTTETQNAFELENSEDDYNKSQDSYEHDLAFINKQHHIIFWQYKPYSSYIDISEFLPSLSLEYNHKVTSWRHLFNQKTLSEIISIAKSVRDSKLIQSYALTLENGIQLEIFIDFDGVSWFGTLSHDKKSELLKASVKSLKKKHKEIEKNAEEELSGIVDKFSQVILRTMIQSQSSSVDIDATSLPVYRQLTRILDWCGQRNIVSQLESSPQSVQNIDIRFEEELHAIVLNAMSEARFQKNEVYLKLDKALLPFVSIDHFLFHNMLISMIRSILSELYNAKMFIELEVVDTDTNTGNQTIQFTFTVNTAEQLKMLPDLVNKLVNESRNSQLTSNVILYLNTLMQRFNISQVQGALNKSGFSVKFSMPLTAQNLDLESQSIQPINLENISVISLGSCKHHQAMIKQSLSEMNCEVITLNSVNRLIKELTIEVLERKPIPLMIVNDDISATSLVKVKAFQMSLPENLQFKIFVMQSPVNAKYHKQGLYNQASVPLFNQGFQNKVNELLNDKALDNLLIDAEVLSQYQYFPSRVELLLAVSVPESHQMLINILQWLGIQVHVVSQSNAMLKKWQSGRYLLLMSEFTESPYVRFSTGNKVQRGIFTFEDELFSTPTGRLLELTKHWKVSVLPDVLDIKALVELLEPWLKSKTTMVARPKKADVVNVQQYPSYNELLSEANKQDNTEKEKLKQHQQLNTKKKDVQVNHVTSEPQNNILDMEKYALNQGSFELAVFMLDEYLSDIDVAIIDMEKAINQESLHDMQKPIQTILKLSQILGASELNVEMLTLKTLSESDTMKNNFSIFKESNTRLRSHLKALESFSKAI